MRRGFRFLTLVAALLAPTRAFADEAAARGHFRKGIDLYDGHDFAAALIEFEAAYREKPSAGIKQNIALSLNGLNRPAEAATAFDEALEEGKDTLKPETRAAIEAELTELSRIVATVNVSAPAGATVRVRPGGEIHGRRLRFVPGTYTFVAKLPGQPDPAPKTVTLVAGAPVDIAFVATSGTLTIRVNVPEATIILDGAVVGTGTWTGTTTATRHAVEVSAKGYRELAFDVTVPPGATVESPVSLQAVGAEPPEYAVSEPPAPKWRRIYLVPAASVDVASYRNAPVLDEPAGGARHGFVGASIGGRVGYEARKVLGVELLAEVGDLVAKYHTNISGGGDTTTSIVHWQITPMIRLTTPGRVRFTAGTGIGLHGLALSSTLARGATTADESGGGISASWILDSGVQFDVGPLFLEAALLLDVHGTGTPTSDDPGNPRLLLASPGAREGLRVGLGIPF